MFKHAFHGGPAVEIFSVSGKNPLEKWKTTGSIPKTFDSNMKSFIFTVEGSSKIQLPKDEKELLGLIQPFLVLQIFIPLGKNIHIEVGITDSTKTRRRLIFHTGAKELVANPLHARIPITNFRRNQWTNLAIDIHTFTHHCFKGVNFRSIDLLIITASCKLRRIFTMKNPLYDDQTEEDLELQQLINLMMAEELRDNMPFVYAPQNLEFPQNFIHYNQLIFPHRLRQKTQAHDENINIGNNNASKEQKVQLAFGQRMLKKQEPPQGQKPLSKQPTTANTNQRNMQQQSVITGTKINKNKDLMQVQNDQDDDFESKTNQKSSRNATDRKLSQQEDQQEYQDQNIDAIEEEEGFNEYQNDFDNNENNTFNNQEASRQYVTKEELKEGEHFLYLQNDSDEEQKVQTISKKDNNPWDKMGRKNHDLTTQKTSNLIGTASKSNIKQNHQQNSLIKESSSLKKKVNYQLEEKNEEDFYSPIESERDQRQQIDIRVQQEMNDYQLRQQEQKVQQMRKQVQNIESKYNKQDLNGIDSKQLEDIKSPELSKNRQKSKLNSKVATNNRVKLKQDQKKEEEEEIDQDGFRRFTNNQMKHLNLESWGTMQKEEDDDMIEEAFDMINNNLMNFDDKNQASYQKSLKDRKSKEFKENPMYIEFELNNEDEDEIQDQVNGIETQEKERTMNVQNIDKEITQSYIRLESSRKEERRPFSPPFQVQDSLLQRDATEIHTVIDQQDDEIVLEHQDYEQHHDEDTYIVQSVDFKRKLDFLKVQRADILRDSLDQTVPKSNYKQDMPQNATVENEDGDLLEVIFDPILQCYYDPKSNTYYELKAQD